MNPIRALILDLDRTLLRSDRSLSAYTKETLARCQSKGMKIAIATARPPRAAETYAAQISPDAVISLNGAQLRMGGRTVMSAGMTAEDARAFIRGLEAHLPGRRWSAETESGFCANFDVSLVWPEESARLVDADSLPDGPVYKVLVDLLRPDEAGVMRALLPENAYLEIAEGTLAMVIHRDATKLRGMLAALGIWGIQTENAASFGDDLADIGMLSACGCGVAVANALAEVKAAADFITASNDEDGVACWLEAHAGI